MSTEINLDDLKYNDLKSLAKERGLDASGTKEDLLARLRTAGSSSTPTPSDDESGDTGQTGAPQTTPEVTPTTAEPMPAVERAENTKADRELRTDAAKMKAHLEAQPKVSIMIPFEVGENPENGKKVKFHVNLNGYMQEYERGVYIEVPLQIANMIKERLESEGKIGQDWRIDRDPSKQEALG